jgi:hypothetical protein
MSPILAPRKLDLTPRTPHPFDTAMETMSRRCQRKACGRPGATYFNTSTRAYYCPSCAKAINEYAPGLCVLQPT